MSGHHGPVRHLYGSVVTRAWDELVRLSPMAQLIVMRLLTANEKLPIPGVARVGRAALAEAMEQPARQVERALDELERTGAIIADWKARLIWVQVGPRDFADAATSTAVAASWRRVLNELPTCPLRTRIDEAIRLGLGDGPIGESYAAGTSHRRVVIRWMSAALPARGGRPRRTMNRRGFTLIELMIVVTIVGVLSVIAMVAYRKYRIAGRRAEVYSLFGEIKLKEEAYRAEFSTYVSTSASEDTFYPTTPNNTPQTWAPPVGPWTQLAFNPGRNQVYCGYNVIAGVPAVAGLLGARGTAWFGGAVPTTQWWYANASCDNDGAGGTNAAWITSSGNDAIGETNPQQ